MGFQIRIIVQSMIEFQNMEDAADACAGDRQHHPRALHRARRRSFACWRPAAPSTRRSRSIPQHTIGQLLYALGDGQWDIPALRLLLETIIPEQDRHGRLRGRARFPGPRPPDHAAERPQGRLREQRRHHDPARLHRRHRAPRDRAREGRASRSRPKSCCARKRSCCRKCSTASPTACRSSPAS